MLLGKSLSANGWRSRGAAVCLAILGAASGCGPLERYDPAGSDWSPEYGWYPSVEPGGRTASPERLRKESREAFDGKAYRDALDGYLSLRNRFPQAPEARDVSTLFLIAECYYHLGEGEYINAHPFYLQVLRADPPEEVLQETLTRIYDIGIAFLHGSAKKTFLGIPYRSPSFGVEVLTGPDGLVTNYPFLEISEDALMEVGKHYFDGGEFAEAEQAYERFVRDYPRSRWTPTAEYQLALSGFRQVRGVDYDREVLLRARTKFNSYLNHNPRGAQVEEARKLLRELAEMEGERDLRIAKYYLRESRPEAAKLYLKAVFINNAGTDAAREARAIFENLETRAPSGA